MNLSPASGLIIEEWIEPIWNKFKFGMKGTACRGFRKNETKIKQMIIYCVRHGESKYNAEGRIQGKLDIELSDFGLEQGRVTADFFRENPIDAIVSSPLSRAYETAKFVSEATGLAIQTDDRLMEIDAGIFQGKNWDEIADEYPEDAEK